MSDLGDNLKRIREQRNLSQDAVAIRGRDLGENWSQSTVARWEAGERDVTLQEFFTLAMILNIPPGKSIRDLARDLTPNHPRPGQRRRVALDGPGETEQKAARKLGITPERVAELAQRLWHCTLTEKRNRVFRERLKGKSEDAIPKRTRQAMRGRITTRLLKELENVLKERTTK